ncbi:WXG100 family type VII secretion target [Nocardia sp. NPDC024068]|uniref:WXG100 family type VII secretion target n=1 Tax=Nocardia sp. NPDC024068 TaxID=3157197 RepID=UPI0033FA9E9B
MSPADSTSATSVTIQPEEVLAVGRMAYVIATDLKAGTISLGADVEGLQDTWRGSAAAAYLLGWEEMRAGVLEVWEALFEIAEKLGSTQKTIA